MKALRIGAFLKNFDVLKSCLEAATIYHPEGSAASSPTGGQALRGSYPDVAKPVIVTLLLGRLLRELPVTYLVCSE